MQSATVNEIEYLNSRTKQAVDDGLVTESIRHLEALRRYDQFCCADDWRPQRGDAVTRRRAK